MRSPVLTLSVLLLSSGPVYAQDRAWELMDELDIVPPRSLEPERGSFIGAPVSSSAILPQNTPLLTSPGVGAKKEEILQSNMTQAEVRNVLGDPEVVTASSQKQNETWIYGKSKLFFQGDRLSGWSDAGELHSKAIAHLVMVPKLSTRTIFADNGWKNSWEREPRPNAGDVVDDLILDLDGPETGDSYSSPDSKLPSLSASSVDIEGSFPRKSSSN